MPDLTTFELTLIQAIDALNDLRTEGEAIRVDIAHRKVDLDRVDAFIKRTLESILSVEQLKELVLAAKAILNALGMSMVIEVPVAEVSTSTSTETTLTGETSVTAETSTTSATGETVEPVL
jgi:hypothetical protein